MDGSPFLGLLLAIGKGKPKAMTEDKEKDQPTSASLPDKKESEAEHRPARAALAAAAEARPTTDPEPPPAELEIGTLVAPSGTKKNKELHDQQEGQIVGTVSRGYKVYQETKLLRIARYGYTPAPMPLPSLRRLTVIPQRLTEIEGNSVEIWLK